LGQQFNSAFRYTYYSMLSISYLISKLNNAVKTNQTFIFFPKTFLCLRLLQLLHAHGVILKAVETPSGGHFKIYLKYTSNSTSSFQKMSLLSTPTKKIYLDYRKLSKINQGIGLFIISTSFGLFTNYECMRRKIGGTILCFIV
jgi:small subunit ribosomal protein S8